MAPSYEQKTAKIGEIHGTVNLGFKRPVHEGYMPVDTATWRSTSCCFRAGQVTRGVTFGRPNSHVTHTPPGATAKTVHCFYFNKDPPSFINATDAGAMAFKNECASVRSAGASLLWGSAKKGASAARALATGAKVKTTAVKDEEQPQQQQVQQQQQRARGQCRAVQACSRLA